MGVGIISGHNASQRSISVNGKAGEVHPTYHGVEAAPFQGKDTMCPELVGLFLAECFAEEDAELVVSLGHLHFSL